MISRQEPRKRKKLTEMMQNVGWWTNGYANWSETEFKHRVRINRNNFEFILRILGPYISKTPTNPVPNPIENHRQLAVTMYRLAHGPYFLPCISEALAVETFDHSCGARTCCAFVFPFR